MRTGRIAIRTVIKLSKRKVQKPELVDTHVFQNLVIAMLSIMAEKDTVCHETINLIEVIRNLIKIELETP